MNSALQILDSILFLGGNLVFFLTSKLNDNEARNYEHYTVAFCNASFFSLIYLFY